MPLTPEQLAQVYKKLGITPVISPSPIPLGTPPPLLGAGYGFPSPPPPAVPNGDAEAMAAVDAYAKKYGIPSIADKPGAPSEIAPVVMEATPAPKVSDAEAMAAVDAYAKKKGIPSIVDQPKMLPSGTLVIPKSGAPAPATPAAPPPGEFGPPLSPEMKAKAEAAKLKAKVLGMGYGGPGNGGFSVDKMYSPAEKELIALQKKELDLKLRAESDMADEAALGELYKKNTLQGAVLEAEDMDEANAAREADRQQYVRDTLRQHEQDADALANSRVDFGRWWKNKSSGEKVSGAIALVLAGMAQQFTGGRNLALDIMNQEIEKDVHEQKMDVENKYASLAARRNVFAQKLATFGDERIAEASMKSNYLNGIQRQIEARMAAVKGEVAQKNGATLLQLVDIEKQKLDAEIAKGAEDRWKLIQKQKADAAAAMAAKVAKRDEVVFMGKWEVAKERAKALGGDPTVSEAGEPIVVKDGKILWTGIEEAKVGGGKVSVPTITSFNAKGEPVYGGSVVTSKEDAPKLKKAQETYAAMKSKIEQLKELHANSGYLYDSAETKAKASVLVGDMITDYSVLKELGAISEGDRTLINEVIPSKAEVLTKSWIGTDGAAAKIDALGKIIDQKMGSSLASAGAPPMTLQLTAPPK